MAVFIQNVTNPSPAYTAGFRSGMYLLGIDGHQINDMLDYEFYTTKSKLQCSVSYGEELQYFDIEKEEYEPLGLDFETYLMDTQHACRNKCIFCFVDQLPKGMRDALYFKDDDERLSFLFGNYITLTNLTQREVDRIKEMHISPMNISVHTMDPELRVEMMGNKDAGKVLAFINDFAKANIAMNIQIVLCRGVNDGEKLVASIRKLSALYPAVQSVAVVPAGITKFRDNLADIAPFDEESAANIIDIIDTFAEKNYKKKSVRLVYPADEFFLLAKRPLPKDEYYDEMLQLENGVGMWRLFYDEFVEELAKFEGDEQRAAEVDVAVGESAELLFKQLSMLLNIKFKNVKINLHVIKNNFFGGNISVTGLLTGSDIIAQLRGNLKTEKLLLAENVLRSEKDYTLDDYTPRAMAAALCTEIITVPVNGGEYLRTVLGVKNA